MLLEGSSIEELLAQVRAEHGPAARIVHADRVRSGGIGGFFAKERFEIQVEVADDAAHSGSGVLAAGLDILDLVDTADSRDIRDSVDTRDIRDSAREQRRRSDRPEVRREVELVQTATTAEGDPLVSTDSPSFARLLAALSKDAEVLPDPEPAPAPARPVRPAFPHLAAEQTVSARRTAPAEPVAEAEDPAEVLLRERAAFEAILAEPVVEEPVPAPVVAPVVIAPVVAAAAPVAVAVEEPKPFAPMAPAAVVLTAAPVVAAVTPPPAPMAEPEVVEPVAVVEEAAPAPVEEPEPVLPPRGRSAQQMVAVGVPRELVAGLPARIDIESAAAAVAAALPPVPACADRSGAVIAIVGEGRAAYDEARRQAARLGLVADDVALVARTPLGLDLGGRGHVGDRDALSRSIEKWRASDLPTVVAVDMPMRGIGAEWAQRMLAALGADTTWAVVDASRKLAENSAQLRRLPGVDALVVTNAEATTTPGEVLVLNHPVAVVDGDRASRGRWAELLVAAATQEEAEER
ncbi:hypothetical protein [Motilibacter rhizosphaerae]|uniref:hypothetical protein n=1 Tax=Motilibacter rhizosphaerae TaxID=598652 RepID=UPI00102C92BA|nr:hypothetical protein [Motilibacter rhizosphaerae]